MRLLIGFILANCVGNVALASCMYDPNSHQSGTFKIKKIEPALMGCDAGSPMKEGRLEGCMITFETIHKHEKNQDLPKTSIAYTAGPPCEWKVGSHHDLGLQQPCCDLWGLTSTCDSNGKVNFAGTNPHDRIACVKDSWFILGYDEHDPVTKQTSQFRYHGKWERFREGNTERLKQDAINYRKAIEELSAKHCLKISDKEMRESCAFNSATEISMAIQTPQDSERCRGLEEISEQALSRCISGSKILSGQNQVCHLFNFDTDWRKGDELRMCFYYAKVTRDVCRDIENPQRDFCFFGIKSCEFIVDERIKGRCWRYFFDDRLKDLGELRSIDECASFKDESWKYMCYDTLSRHIAETNLVDGARAIAQSDLLSWQKASSARTVVDYYSSKPVYLTPLACLQFGIAEIEKPKRCFESRVPFR